MTGRARVIRGGDAGRAAPVAAGASATRGRAPLARIIARPIAEAKNEAHALLEQARAEARQIVARAEATAHDLILEQQARARADALCLVVGEALELRKRQAELSRNVLDRSIDFATLLAERLLGEQLTLAPERVRSLARQVLEEAAGARHAIIVAHPRDATELRAGLSSLGSLLDSIGIEDDDRLGRGHIRVETELGVLEADLHGRLERLSAQLRKLLTAHAPENA